MYIILCIIISGFSYTCNINLNIDLAVIEGNLSLFVLCSLIERYQIFLFTRQSPHLSILPNQKPPYIKAALGHRFCSCITMSRQRKVFSFWLAHLNFGRIIRRVKDLSACWCQSMTASAGSRAPTADN